MILDVQVGNDPDYGYATAQRLKADNAARAVPIMLVTATDLDPDQAKFLERASIPGS